MNAWVTSEIDDPTSTTSTTNRWWDDEDDVRTGVGAASVDETNASASSSSYGYFYDASCSCAATPRHVDPWTTKECGYSLSSLIRRHVPFLFRRLARQYYDPNQGLIPLTLCLMITGTLVLGFGLGWWCCCRYSSSVRDDSKKLNQEMGRRSRSYNTFQLFSTMMAQSTQLVWKIRCWIVASILGYWTRRSNIYSSQVPPKPQQPPTNMDSLAKRLNSTSTNDSNSVSASVLPDPSPHNRSSIAPPLPFDDDAVRQEQQQQQKLQSAMMPQSGLSADELPRHLAVIMDGNRRYGRQHWGNAWAGHWHGSRQLLQFTRWCLAEGIPEVTFFAFSTENWQRDAAEVAALMQLIVQHCRELQREAVALGIRVHVATTDPESLPVAVQDAVRELEEQQQQLEQQQQQQQQPRMLLNICLSYGSRGELVQACQRVVDDCRQGHLDGVTEEALTARLGIRSPVDLLLRTSGERRLSNFLLWQSAYAELFFVDQKWPELQREDLVDVLRRYARTRQRRFGK